MTPNSRLLEGDFYDNHLIVNDPTCSTQLLLPCTLYYTLPAPQALDAAPKIKITASIGEAASHMFSTRDSDYGNMICPGFDYRGCTKRDNRLTYSLTCSDDRAFPGTAKTLTLEWTDIISTACEGICSVTVALSNFGSDIDGEASYYLYKSRAQTEICYFEASPASACPGEEITLSWKVINATKGYILPGGYDIFEEGVQSASSRCVPMPSDNSSFFLYVLGEQQNVYRETKVFTPPPSIDLLIEGRTAKWECHFAKAYELAENKVYHNIEASGSLTLQPTTVSLAIRCTGDNVSEEEIRLLAGDNNIQFIKYIHEYPKHKVITVSWKVPEDTAATIELLDTCTYVISQEREGLFEYPFSLKKNVFARITYTQKGKTPVSYLL